MDKRVLVSVVIFAIIISTVLFYYMQASPGETNNNIGDSSDFIEINNTYFEYDLPDLGEPMITETSFDEPQNLDRGSYDNVEVVQNGESYLRPIDMGSASFSDVYSVEGYDTIEYLTTTFRNPDNVPLEIHLLGENITPVHIKLTETGNTTETVGIDLSGYDLSLNQDSIKVKVYSVWENKTAPQMYDFRIYGK